MCELWMRFVADDPQSRYMVRHAGNQSWRRGADLSGPPPDWAPLRPECLLLADSVEKLRAFFDEL
jgi:hypothetical protein